jgi:glucose-1-phosphate cytidylyltransferase
MGAKTESSPKPLLKIGDRPILWHIMKHYSVFGFRDFILCLGYKGEQIRSYFEELNDGREQPWKISCVDTGLDSPTGLRLRKIQNQISEDTFLATYGDSIVNVSVPLVIERHFKMKKIGTVVGMKVRLKFGLFQSSDGTALSFEEKPELPVGLINAGFFVFNRKIFEYLDDGPLENKPIKTLIDNRELAIYEHSGIHRGIDTASDLESVNEEWNRGSAPWKTW